eukprot:7899139-Lingulodinium_polyedra.AAC.1
MKARVPESDVATERVAAECKRNIRNVIKDSSARVARGIVKTPLAAARRALSVPEIAALMRSAN